jgi:uncharacterized protein YdeI (YjbR/CyaY-like superfamily)
MTTKRKAEEKIETFRPTSSKSWRKWLEKNHDSKKAVWLLCYRKKTNKPTVTWSEAVDEALCFGWIDSIRKSIDEESFIQYFSPRKPRSTWSKVNKEKIKVLTKEGRMTKAGLEKIEVAKKNGSWEILNSVDDLTIPADLEKTFKSKPKLRKYFLGLSKSVQKQTLHRLVMAKRPETREKRIAEFVEEATAKMKLIAVEKG